MEAETLLCIAYGCGHCDDEVRCRAGSGAEDAETAGSEAKLADEDGGGWDCWLVGEGSEEGGYDVVDVGCEGSVKSFTASECVLPSHQICVFWAETTHGESTVLAESSAWMGSTAQEVPISIK